MADPLKCLRDKISRNTWTFVVSLILGITVIVVLICTIIVLYNESLPKVVMFICLILNTLGGPVIGVFGSEVVSIFKNRGKTTDALRIERLTTNVEEIQIRMQDTSENGMSVQDIGTIRGLLEQGIKTVTPKHAQQQFSGIHDTVLQEIKAYGDTFIQKTHTDVRPIIPTTSASARLDDMIDDTTKIYLQYSTKLHECKFFEPEVLSLDLDPMKILTGGNDCCVIVYDPNGKRTIGAMNCHKRSVTHVACARINSLEISISGSEDSIVKINTLAMPGEGQVFKSTEQSVTVHENKITGLAVHPTGHYFISTAKDTTYAFTDISTGKLLIKEVVDEQNFCTTVQFHPQGHNFGAVIGSTVRLWDVRRSKQLCTIEGDVRKITSFLFSPNGNTLAISGASGFLKIFDTRKLQYEGEVTLPLLKSINIQNPAHSMDFDPTGDYLGVNGQQLSVINMKSWNPIQLNDGDRQNVFGTGVRFQESSSFVASFRDGTLSFYKLQQESTDL